MLAPPQTAFAALAVAIAASWMASTGLAPAQAPEAQSSASQPGDPQAMGGETDKPLAIPADKPEPSQAQAETKPLDAPTTKPPAEDAQPGAGPAANASPVQGDAARLWSWVVAAHDNKNLPFAIVDKRAAAVFVFDAGGSLLGGAPVLVGLAKGDDSVAGIGDRDLSAIRPEERTTPAGRFETRFGATPSDRNVLWVDYATSISMHPVVTSNPSEHRLKRIKSQEPADHRITFGCINVPASFYTGVVLTAFSGGAGVVYILPESRPLEEVFPGLTAVDAAASEKQDVQGASPDQGQRPPPQ